MDGAATIVVEGGIEGATTYTIGDQTFTFKSDADNKPVTFTVENNVVTAITGLDEDATLTITNNAAEDYAVTVNNHETAFTAAANASKTVLGIEDGDDATDLDTGAYYVTFDGTEITVYNVDENGAVSEETIEADNFGTVADGVITMKEGLVPSSENRVIIEATAPVELQSANGKVYFSGLNGAAVEIEDTSLKLVVNSEGTIADATEIPAEGEITIPAGDNLTVTDNIGVVATSETTIAFADGGTINLTGASYSLVAGDELVASGDSEELTVVIENDTITSITALSENGTVEFGGKTYAMLADGKLTVTDSEGNIKIYSEQGEETDLLALNEEDALNYVQVGEDGTVDLAAGVEDLKGITTDFDATVTTPANEEPVTVNGTEYTPANENGLTVAANADGTSALENGAVVATGDTAVGEDSVGVSGEVTLTAEDGKVTEVAGLDEGDEVTLGEDTIAGTADGTAAVKVTENEDGTTTYEATAPVKIDDATIIPTGNEPVAVTKTDDGFKIGDEELTVTGDEDYSIESAGEGIDKVAGISDGAAVNIKGTEENPAAAEVETTGEGTVSINGAEFEVAGDEDVVTFGVENDSVASVDGLDGTVSGDFSEPISVNGEEIQVEGDEDDKVNVAAKTGEDGGVSAISGINGSDVTVASAGSADEVVTEGEGKVTFGTGSDTQVFETTDEDGVGFKVGEDGKVTGVDSLEGDLAVAGTGEEFTVNDTPVTIGAGDEVTLSTGDEGEITGVAGLESSIEGLPANATVGVADNDVTINGTELAIDEGEDGTEYTATLNEDGTPATIEGLSDGATVSKVPAGTELTTEGEGTFTIGEDEVTVSGDNGGVTFTTGEDGGVAAVEGLEGDIALTGNNSLTVNGDAVAVDKAAGNEDAVTISGSADGVDAVAGLESGDSISGKRRTQRYRNSNGRHGLRYNTCKLDSQRQ